jgi:hypothetical protein
MTGRRSLVPVLLRDRVFRRYWSASTISDFGDQVSGIALPLAAVIALHAGAAQMGYLTALEWLPSLLFGLPAGAWVDRWVKAGVHSLHRMGAVPEGGASQLSGGGDAA